MAAALAAKRVNPRARVVVFEQSHHYAVASCGIPAVIDGRLPAIDSLVHDDPAEFKKLYDVDLFLLHEAVRIFPARRVVEVRRVDTGGIAEFPYSSLVIATGARPRDPNTPGVMTIRYPGDVPPLMKEIGKAKSVHIHGSGVLGLTLAAATSRIPSLTTFLLGSDRILPAFPPEASIEIQAERERLGIHWEGRDTFASWHEPSEVHIAAKGVLPQVPKGLRLREGWKDGIPVDRWCRTDIDHILACGDCALVYNQVTRGKEFSPGAVTANRTGKIAGMNAAGAAERFAGTVAPLAFVFGDIELGRVGLTDLQLRRDYGSAIRVKGVYRLHPAYIGPDKIHMDMAVDASSGQIISFHAWGGHGVAERVNRVGSWIQGGLAVQKLVHMETAYFPEFSAITDPLLALLNHVVRQLKDRKVQGGHV